LHQSLQQQVLARLPQQMQMQMGRCGVRLVMQQNMNRVKHTQKRTQSQRRQLAAMMHRSRRRLVLLVPQSSNLAKQRWKQLQQQQEQ
jgi:hypothetical protein